MSFPFEERNGSVCHAKGSHLLSQWLTNEFADHHVRPLKYFTFFDKSALSCAFQMCPCLSSYPSPFSEDPPNLPKTQEIKDMASVHSDKCWFHISCFMLLIEPLHVDYQPALCRHLSWPPLLKS